MPGLEDVEVPEPDAVLQRLAELGVPLEILLEAVRRGQLAGDFCTESHPRFYRGIVVYSEINGGLREQLAGLGWSFNDEDNIARAISPDGTVVVTGVAGNERTGLRSTPHAQTQRPRREAGIRIVRRNSQLELEELLPADERRDGDAVVVTGPTWFLLWYRTEDKIRSELSLARGVTAGGALLEWSERLILPGIDLLDGPNASGSEAGPEGPDVVVPVERLG
jgi:hypothetical protein